MNIKRAFSYSLVTLCILSSFASPSASYATCTPVVYAFRHAEDEAVDLTAVGYVHALLYPDMITKFQGGLYCPVRYVYSMYYINLDGTPGTNNPYETAHPLAASSSVSGAPIVFIGGKQLDEHLTKATPLHLRTELVTNAQAGSSSAIFWTKQGLHDLGAAVAPTTNIPLDTSPRNATYVFKYNATLAGCNDETEKTCFDPLPSTSITQYVQCFNITYDDPTRRDTKLYCGNNLTDQSTGNLPGIGTGRNLLKGKICDRFGLPGARAGYYGYCE